MLQTRDPSVSSPFAASFNPSSLPHHVSNDSKISILFGAYRTIIMYLYDAPIAAENLGQRGARQGVRDPVPYQRTVSGLNKF